MGPELIVAIIGPLVGAIIGTAGFMSRRNIALSDSQLSSISESLEVISQNMTNLQIELPTNYVTKEELAQHIRSEEYFHNKMLDQMREMRDEVIVLRSQQH